ncbi:MAG TPA: hypothetical protein IGS17_11960 [Oscillatoriales cyanobacterium M59_W2019_021]|nr:MAG: hypothetical protein D6728_15285 [Cyanobacteria bacterium J055]HIK33798.1 hypothetical protein [Oscillatoriales cyanobacterium M4454_W2019_049]HIK51616.1 hypothetical protein [Oscillatoriales cyanobacterium M59_W2019_021]
MFESKTEILNQGYVRQFYLFEKGDRLKYDRVLKLWQNDAKFRSFFLSILTEVPFDAYRWETPPLTAATANRDFEFVLVNDPGLDRTPDPQPFASYFDTQTTNGIVAFPNLGNDAFLVVPSPRSEATAYGHLAAFVRNASLSQNHALWQHVGRVMEKRLNDRPIWLSTAGGGVSWLHIRLDSYPKYYNFFPYKKIDSVSIQS